MFCNVQITFQDEYNLCCFKYINSKRKPIIRSHRDNETDFIHLFKLKINAITIDWLHDTLYVINTNRQSMFRYTNVSDYFENNKENAVLPLERKFSLFNYLNVAEILQTDGNILMIGAQLDPYEKSLFLQVCIGIEPNVQRCLDNSTHVILRSDLSGENLKLICTEQTFSNKMKWYINVNEVKMYIYENDILYTYDYNGTEVGREHIYNECSRENKGFVVFNNILYIVRNNVINLLPGNTICKTNLNQQSERLQNSPVETSFVTDYSGFKLYDTRSRRRMVNGSYLCDRTDCPEKCVVLPEGDTCVCTKSGVKSIDGLRCYDCGQSNLTTLLDEPMIVGGESATRSDFPWHAILYQQTGFTWELICGGTLITSNVVLTAAHCVRNPISVENLMVALGKVYRDWNTIEPTEIKLRVKRILPHEDYIGGSTNHMFDIALLVLASKVKTSSYVMPACLDYNHNQLPPTNTLTGYIPGLGFTEDCMGNMCSEQSKKLKYAMTKLLTFKECHNASQSIDSSSHITLTQDKFCIGNGSVSAVQKGDSGGGLTLVHKGLHYVSGVVSLRHAKLNQTTSNTFSYSFGSFTNVSYYMNWLKRNLPAEE